MARVLHGLATSVPTEGADAWTGRAMITGVFLTTGAGASTISVYDGIDNTGTLICQLSAAIDDNDGEEFTIPIFCETGIYVQVGTAGTGIKWFVYYK